VKSARKSNEKSANFIRKIPSIGYFSDRKFVFLVVHQNNHAMASSHEILCINKDDRQNPQERITHIGGKNSSGTRWKLTLDDAIRSIEKGEYAFYVYRGGSKVV
jgi:hypothetical protein